MKGGQVEQAGQVLIVKGLTRLRHFGWLQVNSPHYAWVSDFYYPEQLKIRPLLVTLQ